MASAAVFILGLAGYGAKRYRQGRGGGSPIISTYITKQAVELEEDIETDDDENGEERNSNSSPFPICLKSKSLYCSNASGYSDFSAFSDETVKR